MFKKSDNQSDKAPKQENKDYVSKTTEKAEKSATASEETAAPANEDKKS
ncbi:hypothetical protein [Hyphococcus sp. DH-69]